MHPILPTLHLGHPLEPDGEAVPGRGQDEKLTVSDRRIHVDIQHSTSERGKTVGVNRVDCKVTHFCGHLCLLLRSVLLVRFSRRTLTMPPIARSVGPLIMRFAPHCGDCGSVGREVERSGDLETNRLISVKIRGIRGFEVGGHLELIDSGKISRKQAHPDPRPAVESVSTEKA